MSVINTELSDAAARAKTWSPTRKFFLRVTVIYIIQLCVPLSGRFYANLFDWGGADGRSWQAVSRFTGYSLPRYVDVGTEVWEFYSYINLVVALAIAILLATVWSAFDKKGTELNSRYNLLYYWTIVIARYTSALGIIAWGFKKFVPKQMELPSRTFMETPFADFSEQKIYWQYVGISQGYEIFLGFAEISIGLLLLNRKTAGLGATILTLMLFNICLSNHAYDGLVHVGSFMYCVAGGIMAWPYLSKVWKLLVKRENVVPFNYVPDFNRPWAKNTRLAIKGFIVIVFVFYNYYLHITDHVGYRYAHDSPGLKNAAGVYEVTEFKLNNTIIPYSPLDSVRWQDAIFEDWSTFTVLLNKKQHMDNANTARDESKPINRRFEFRGIGGGRHFFHYDADTINRVLHLQNKNKRHREETFDLHYSMPFAGRIVLEGLNQNKETIHVVLDKKNKDYTLKAKLLDFYYSYK
jgi:hypothetical protein